MKKYISLFLLATAAIFTSCVDDEGSYELSPINEMEVTISNEDGYTAYIMGDPVLISADVKGTMAEENDPDRYAYHWYVKIITDMVSQAFRVVDLSSEREFNYTAGDDLIPGSYNLYLEVEDKETGLKVLQQTTLSIASQATTGFLVLGEASDGSTKMDMIATMAEDTVLLENVFTDSNIKSPESLFFTGPLDSYQHLWLTTADQSYSLTSGSYFNLLEDNSIENYMLTSFDVIRPMRVLEMYPHYDPSSRRPARADPNRGYITEDAVFQVSTMASGGILAYGNPINRYDVLSTELFKPYPLAFLTSGYISSFSFYVILYDMDNNVFVMPNSNSSTPTICNKLQGGNLFDWDQKTYPDNRHLVFGQNGIASFSYALLTDDQNKWYIYKFVVNSAKKQELAKEVDLSKAKDFDKATFYAFSDLETEIVYAVESQLWAYDYERQIAKMLKDYGKPIIYLIRDIESTTNNSNFCIATSSGDGTSTLSWFTLGENPDDIIFEEDEDMVWEINSTIKAVQWKNAGDLEDESGYY